MIQKNTVWSTYFSIYTMVYNWFLLTFSISSSGYCDVSYIHCYLPLNLNLCASWKCGGGDWTREVLLFLSTVVWALKYTVLWAKRIVFLLISGCSVKPLLSFDILVWLFRRLTRSWACFVLENLAELQFNSIHLFSVTHTHTTLAPAALHSSLLQQHSSAEYAAVSTAGTNPMQDS